jgi:type VI secretion system protein ImpM
MLTGTSPTDTRDSPGWYGKLSSLGDFAQRRLPPAWISACDGWLSRAMQGSQAQLGAHWLDVYLTAPVLRFAWAPGVVDAQWWFGVLMPSCDNVGRYFPLVVAHPRARAPVDRIALDHLELWYDCLAQAAMSTLGEGASVEVFEEALSQSPPWPTPGPMAALNVQATPYIQRYPLGPGTSLAQWLHMLAATDLQARMAGCTLWWRRSEDGSAGDSVSVLRGLPEPAGFVELLASRV